MTWLLPDYRYGELHWPIFDILGQPRLLDEETRQPTWMYQLFRLQRQHQKRASLLNRNTGGVCNARLPAVIHKNSLRQ